MANYYCLDQNKQPVGPLPLEVIIEKAKSGSIPPNTMIVPEGGNQWQPLASAVPGGGFKLDHFLPDFVDSVLRAVSNVLNARLLDGSIEVARDVGQYGVAAAAALSVLCGIVLAIRNGSFAPLITGLVTALVIVGAQFVATRLFATNNAMLTGSRVRVSSLAPLDCAGLLALLGGISILVSAINICVRYTVWQPLTPAVLIAAFWMYFAAAALHPETVNVAKGEFHGGAEEAIGLALFVIRTFLKLVPLVFFAMTAIGVLIAALSLFDLEEPLMHLAGMVFIPVPFGREMSGHCFVGIAIVLNACLLPLIGYVGFILFSIPIDIWRAILSLPGKVDSLKR